MKVVFLRHAEREFSIHGNPALSSEGLSQAYRLAGDIKNGKLPRPSYLLSSPKKRCLQTLEVMANELNLKIQIEQKLDEQNSQESSQHFRRRIDQFTVELVSQLVSQLVTELGAELGNKPNTPGIAFVCTHSDWLQEAMSVLPEKEGKLSDIFHFPCAQPLILNYEDGFWRPLSVFC